MKLKYYLRGLGVGVICTAIIMGIALSGGKKEQLTDEEIIERARLLGMVMEEEQEETDAQKTAEDLLQEEPDSEDGAEGENSQNHQEPLTENQIPENTQTEENTPESNSNTQEPDQQSQEQQPEQQSQEQPQEQPTEPELRKIEIYPGEYSDVISQKLQDAGLIADAGAFNRYMMSIKVDDILQPGSYQIPVGATEDEIIDILCR